MSKDATGAQRICKALRSNGIEHVFGLPGTQNIALFEALRGSSLRTVVATNELSAAMMANGYYRASGRIAALATIPGPGFTWALTGLAEAALDSAALLHLVGKPASAPGSSFQLQAIDQAAMARPVTRAVLGIDRAADVDEVMAKARMQATAGEPGPVLVEVAPDVLDERPSPAGMSGAAPGPGIAVDGAPAIEHTLLGSIVDALVAADRCVIIAGQGSQGASAAVLRLAERLSAAVVTTTSGRGVVAEDHPLSLGFELAGHGADTLNAAIERADLVLAIGCKFSHNGSHGFRLRIPAGKLIHVDSSPETLAARNYPARHAVRADAARFLDAVLPLLEGRPAAHAGFSAGELARYRELGRAEATRYGVEPRIHGVASGKPADFFAALRTAMPRDSHLVTDSGLHQMLARLHYRVLCPRGLIVPTNLQSMGFAIGTAIGACLSQPDRPTVALLGDGGLAMSGLELLTAVRERLRLTVIVFVDGAYGLIRAQQVAECGHAFGSEFSGPDVAALAATIGARHVRLQGGAESVLRDAIESDGVTLVEVGVGDTLPMHWMRAKGIAKHALGPTLKSKLRRLLGRA